MSTQMALIIILFVGAGFKLDQITALSPLFILIFSLAGVGLSMFIFIRKVMNNDSK